MEKRTIARAEEVYVPLEEIRDYYLKNYGVKSIVVYLPARIERRDYHPFRDFTLVYAGTIPDKGTFNALINVYRKLKGIEKGARFVVLSRFLPRDFENRLKEEGAIVTWVSPNRLNSIISRCHAGLVMEGDNDLSPYLLTTKFIDYLASGIPVIVHEKMKGLCRLVKKWKAGICVSYNAP